MVAKFQKGKKEKFRRPPEKPVLGKMRDERKVAWTCGVIEKKRGAITKTRRTGNCKQKTNREFMGKRQGHKERKRKKRGAGGG